MKGLMQIALLIFCIGVIEGGVPQHPDPPGQPSERENIPRYSCCELYSDPHIITFDGFDFIVQIPGNLTVSKPCETNDFEVLAIFDYPYPGASCNEVAGVIVNYGSTQIVINQNPTALVDGNLVPLHNSMPPDIYISYNGPNIYVRIHTGSVNLIVCYNVNMKSLTVYVHNSWYNKLCGLCGNLNYDPTDDQASVPPGLREPQCPHPKDHEDWAECRRRLRKAMKNCKGKSIKRYLKSCAFDMCAGGMKDAQFTLNAAKEHCNTNINDILSRPPPGMPDFEN